MAKKTKKPSKSGLNLDENSVKAVVSLFVLFVAFSVFLLFNNNKEGLLDSPQLLFFLLLVVLLFGLLTSLLFLVNPHKHRK